MIEKKIVRLTFRAEEWMEDFIKDCALANDRTLSYELRKQWMTLQQLLDQLNPTHMGEPLITDRTQLMQQKRRKNNDPRPLPL